jgi:hypothetical protein
MVEDYCFIQPYSGEDYETMNKMNGPAPLEVSGRVTARRRGGG